MKDGEYIIYDIMAPLIEAAKKVEADNQGGSREMSVTVHDNTEQVIN